MSHLVKWPNRIWIGFQNFSVKVSDVKKFMSCKFNLHRISRKNCCIKFFLSFILMALKMMSTEGSWFLFFKVSFRVLLARDDRYKNISLIKNKSESNLLQECVAMFFLISWNWSVSFYWNKCNIKAFDYKISYIKLIFDLVIKNVPTNNIRNLPEGVSSKPAVFGVFLSCNKRYKRNRSSIPNSH